MLQTVGYERRKGSDRWSRDKQNEGEMGMVERVRNSVSWRKFVCILSEREWKGEEKRARDTERVRERGRANKFMGKVKSIARLGGAACCPGRIYFSFFFLFPLFLSAHRSHCRAANPVPKRSFLFFFLSFFFFFFFFFYIFAKVNWVTWRATWRQNDVRRS